MKREALVFLVVGVLTVLIDLATYRAGLALGGPVSVCKGIGFATGTIFAFFANKFLTFSSHGGTVGQLWKFLLLYAVTFAVNVGVNTAVLATLADLPAAIHLAFLAATGCSAAMNFIGMKFFVFTRASGGTGSEILP